MSVLKTAVLRQIAYARSVRSVIRAIMRRMLDGEWIDRIFASSDEEFNSWLDVALKSLDLRTATKRDFCEAVVGVLCDEVSELCQALKEVCEGGSGYSDYFKSHISHERFVRLVLSVDTVKLGKMKKILEDARLSPIDILRNIGAVLNDEALEERAALGARERRHANAELKAIAADVKKTMQTGFAEVRHDIAAVGEKVDRIKHRAKRRGKYDDVGGHCLDIWEVALADVSLRNSLNTRVTYEAVFARHKDDLEKCRIDKAAKFKKVIHAAQSKRSSDNIKKLEARQDKARQSNNQTLKQ